MSAPSTPALPTTARFARRARSSTHFSVDRRSPGYCRVTFDHPPINTITATTVAELAELVGLIEDDPDLNVVVFDTYTRVRARWRAWDPRSSGLTNDRLRRDWQRRHRASPSVGRSQESSSRRVVAASATMGKWGCAEADPLRSFQTRRDGGSTADSCFRRLVASSRHPGRATVGMSTCSELIDEARIQAVGRSPLSSGCPSWIAVVRARLRLASSARQELGDLPWLPTSRDEYGLEVAALESRLAVDSNLPARKRQRCDFCRRGSRLASRRSIRSQRTVRGLRPASQLKRRL
jgi:hypothetical protein